MQEKIHTMHRNPNHALKMQQGDNPMDVDEPPAKHAKLHDTAQTISLPYSVCQHVDNNYTLFVMYSGHGRSKSSLKEIPHGSWRPFNTDGDAIIVTTIKDTLDTLVKSCRDCSGSCM